MSDDFKENIKEHSTWMRGLNIVLFTVIYSVTEIVIVLVVVLQFLWVLLTRETNDKLLDLGANLGAYIYQILNYVTFNTSDRPFPFADFPSDGAMRSKVAAKPAKKKAAKKKAENKKIENSSDDAADENKGDA